jgi:hypothetical protein
MVCQAESAILFFDLSDCINQTNWMTKLFCIDPGTTKSAYVLYSPVGQRIHRFGIVANEELVGILEGDRLVIEMIKSYGNVMGDSVLMTCVWIGRFIQAWGGGPIDLIPRKTIVTSLCGTSRAKDSNVRSALIDRFSSSGVIVKGRRKRGHIVDPRDSGAVCAIGTKNNPGPLYGFARDMWAALAIGEVWQDVTNDILS